MFLNANHNKNIIIKKSYLQNNLDIFCSVTFWTIKHISGNSCVHGLVHFIVLSLNCQLCKYLREHRAIKGQSFKYVINQKQPEQLGGQVFIVQSPIDRLTAKGR